MAVTVGAQQWDDSGTKHLHNIELPEIVEQERMLRSCLLDVPRIGKHLHFEMRRTLKLHIHSARDWQQMTES
jgi:hypothetical protein